MHYIIIIYTWAARSTLILEKDVNITCSNVSLGRMESPDRPSVAVIQVCYVSPSQLLTIALYSSHEHLHINVHVHVILTQRLRLLLANPFLAVLSR